MSETNYQHMAAWWEEAFDEGLWAAAWSKSLEGLTPEEAAWQPPSGPGVADAGRRHSIWQIVLHMIFWRENWLRRVATGQKPTKEEIAAGSFPMVHHITEEAWAATRAHFNQTQQRIGDVLNNLTPESEPVMYFLPHDSYHFGQINYLRAMLGLKPIE